MGTGKGCPLFTQVTFLPLLSVRLVLSTPVLAAPRANILHDATPLREAISEPRFVKLFGEAKPHPKGLRRNVFGEEDQLKVAPKGVAKDHP